MDFFVCSAYEPNRTNESACSSSCIRHRKSPRSDLLHIRMRHKYFLFRVSPTSTDGRRMNNIALQNMMQLIDNPSRTHFWCCMVSSSFQWYWWLEFRCTDTAQIFLRTIQRTKKREVCVFFSFESGNWWDVIINLSLKCAISIKEYILKVMIQWIPWKLRVIVWLSFRWSSNNYRIILDRNIRCLIPPR